MSEGAASRALREALAGVTRPASDKAAIQLARRYAALLDQATPASVYRKAIERVGRVVARSSDQELKEAFARIVDALGAHSVASDIGPKYLAVLAQLGMTPAARGERGDQAPAPAPAAQVPSPRNELKERREQRARGRRADDPR